MDDIEYVIVVVDATAAEAVSAAAVELDARDREAAPIQGLGGSIAEWLIVGTLTSHAVTRLLMAILPYVEGRRIKSIKAGDVEIMSPRPEDVARVIELHFSQERDSREVDN
jgi:hypothetical protein